ncbi:helix-turn-helix domain-containing protein [Candidatus Gottesmanbacteria bacterium]|nr:helix-turn-helix domain-containing protein [Candidatus Gottesmanbacteria bacterium]
MKTVGDILKKKREEKNLTFSEIEKAIKIRKTYLEALENGDYHSLPPAAFTRGFIKNYSDYLGLQSREILALYRREFDEQKDKRLLPQDISKTTDEARFGLTPSKLTILIVFGLLVGFFSYLGYQYQKLSGGPGLIVYSPAENTILTQKEIEVSGKTEPETIVKINGQTITSSNGKFSQFITLSQGLNSIIIEAQGRNGKSSKVERHVRLE